MPLPRSTMAGRTARVAATGAKKFTSKVWRKSSSVMSTSRTPGSWAALLTSRSTGPCAAATSSRARRRASVSATSQVMVPDPGVKVRRSVASFSSRSVLRARPETVAPARARSTAELGAQAGRGPGDDGHPALVAAAEVGWAGRGGEAGQDHAARQGAGAGGSVSSVQVGPEPGRRLGQHVLAGHERRQVAPHPHAPRRQRVGRVELARGPWPAPRRSRARWSPCRSRPPRDRAPRRARPPATVSTQVHVPAALARRPARR